MSSRIPSAAVFRTSIYHSTIPTAGFANMQRPGLAGRRSILAAERAPDKFRKLSDPSPRAGPPATFIDLRDEPAMVCRAARLVRGTNRAEPTVSPRNSIRARRPIVLRLKFVHGVGNRKPDGLGLVEDPTTTRSKHQSCSFEDIRNPGEAGSSEPVRTDFTSQAR